jgi:hypothetical protein
MTTRLNSGSPDGILSGYSAEGIPSDFHIPACSVEDVDQALFKLFDEELGLQVTTEKQGVTDIPVIFATGERFALVKRKKPIRDVNNVLILPLVSIRRTGMQQSNADMTDRGINQHTGDLTIKRRLSTDDRAYQQLINKLGIRNQNNVATTEAGEGTRQLRTERSIGANEHDLDILDGALLAPKTHNNIYEFITIPQPQFYTATYEIVFYTQYTQHMNALLNRMMEMYLPQGRQFRLNTEKGYWFVASFGDSIAADDDFDDFSEKERIIKAAITCEVRAYLIPGASPGDETPIRRFVSAPEISFDIQEKMYNFEKDPYRNADDPTDDYLLTQEQNPETRNQPSDKRLKYISYYETVKNPFTNKDAKRHFRVVSLDKNVGESVLKEL